MLSTRLAYNPWVFGLARYNRLSRFIALADKLYLNTRIVLFDTLVVRVENVCNGALLEGICETPLAMQKASRSWTVPSKAKELPFGSNASNGI